MTNSLKSKSPLLRKKARQKRGYPADYGFDLEVVVSQTFSEAAGPSEMVPSGVVRVRV